MVESTFSGFSDLVLAGEIIENMIKMGKIQNSTRLRELGPPLVVLPPDYDENAHYEFHYGAPWYSIENCKGLKYKVQDLIDSKAIRFTSNDPNVNNNPVPPHDNINVNMTELDNGRKMITFVKDLKTPLMEIKNVLSRSNAFSPSIIKNVSTLEIPYDEVPPSQIPYNLSQLTLLTNPVTPMIITVPTLFPYNNTRVVPWMCDTPVYMHSQKVQEEPIKSDDPLISIAGTGGVTRSDRISAPAPPPIENGGPSTNDRGKQVNNTPLRQDPLTTSEVDEFMCIIKRSDYRVVKQLNQTPSKISMLSLLMCSEANRDALVKFLKAARISQEILVCLFEGVVNNIAISLSLGFNDTKLPVEGRNHNKVLHISIKCVDTILSIVLVDTGSSLNVMPKSSLDKLTIEGLIMKPSKLVVRAFDGSRRIAIG
ncbi:uncharacterized protein LOC127131453 [Lathyrus oleraceus]|uniref:uncharacterized protein LOC127131453 n=1 Tax=Pisum sativum TaxID=3888 RepID=UPI0021D2187A|nr:uncharacterized protein LOC127131453 [Pisum sativum]